MVEDNNQNQVDGTEKAPSVKDVAKAEKNIAKGAAQAATGNYLGAAINFAKSFKQLGPLLKERLSLKKNNLLPAATAFVLVAIVCFSVFGLFIVGVKNMLPGTKGGTTFAKSTISYDSLTAIRMKSEGDQGAQALMKEIQLNGTSRLNTDINRVLSEVESKGTLKDPKLTEFRGLVQDTLNELSILAGMPSNTDEEKAAFTTKAKLVSTNIDKILTVFEENVVGQANTVGFYALPSSPYYINQNGPERQWGRKELIIIIGMVAKGFSEKYPGKKLIIGDISDENGDILPTRSNKTAHRQWTHKCGLDADIMIAPDNNLITVGSATYNQSMASDLADMFLSAGIKRILYEFPGGTDSRFTYISGHKDHLHIRLTNDWDHYPGCMP